MKPRFEDAQPLPAQRAFVVQVHLDAEVAQGRVSGRVEHVVSGQSAHFCTVDDLVVFMASVLHERRAKP